MQYTKSQTDGKYLKWTFRSEKLMTFMIFTILTIIINLQYLCDIV